MEQRNYLIDIFRIIAAFFVICIHAPFLTWGTNPIYKCAVPFFCLVTGYYMKKMDKKIFLKKIFKYFQILLIAFSVYFGLYILFEDQSILVPDILNLIVFNSFGFINAPHLWYLLSLIICLFIIYIFQSNRFYIFLFIPLIIVSPLGKYNIYPFSELIKYYDANFLFTMMPYVSLGMLIRRFNKKMLEIDRYIYLSIAIFFCLLSICESKIFGLNLSEKSAFYIGTPFYSVAIFLFLLSIKLPYNPIIEQTADFSKNVSLLIYIWHLGVINILKAFSLYDYIQPFVALVVYVFLICIILLFEKLTNYAKKRLCN